VFKGFLDDGGADAVGGAQSLAAKLISITSTISRASFGVEYQTTFVEGVHLEEDKFWDSDRGEHRADNQMKWYVKKVSIQ
jgi:hypothetical protein